MLRKIPIRDAAGKPWDKNDNDVYVISNPEYSPGTLESFVTERFTSFYADGLCHTRYFKVSGYDNKITYDQCFSKADEMENLRINQSDILPECPACLVNITEEIYKCLKQENPSQGLLMYSQVMSLSRETSLKSNPLGSEAPAHAAFAVPKSLE